MDLGAYMQIERLKNIAADNRISVERLRGYRLMSEEEPLNVLDLSEVYSNVLARAYEDICRASPAWSANPFWGYEYSERTNRRCKKYLIYDSEGKKIIGFRWDKLHGKRRKNLKYLIKRRMKVEKTQWKMWNKYAGRGDILYIHAKLGSFNWSGMSWQDYRSEPWFVDACDDSDRAYCDIYAKITSEAKEV